MARIILLPENRKIEEAMVIILGMMRVRKISQEKMANHLCITRKTFSDRLRSGTLTYKDLIQIFDVLELPKEKVTELMMLKAERSE